MKTLLASLTATVLIALTASGDARANPCCDQDVIEVRTYRPVYRVRRVRRVRPWRPLRWSAGLHVTGLSTTQKIADDGVFLGGVGGQVRLRGFRFGAEVSFDVLGGGYLNHQVSRVSVPIYMSGLLYLIPRGALNLYLVGGLQFVISHVQWDLSNLYADQTFTQVGLHVGVGAELNLSRQFALTADLRFLGLMRAEDSGDGRYYQDIDQETVIPHKTGGAQATLGVMVRF